MRPVYEPGGVEMRPEARYALERVKAVLEEFPTLAVIVVGHVDADEASSKDAQIALSRGRAASARAQLLALGVAPHRVVIDGVGASRPRDVSRSAEARARNRRVEFELRPTAGKRITP